MNIRRIAVVCLVLATALCPPAFGAVAKVASCPPGKRPDIQTLHGMFTVHVVCDRVMFEIPPAMLNRDILANTEFAALSAGSDFVAPGSAVDNRVIRLVRLGNKVYLEDVRYEIWARAAQTNLQRGVEAASLRTVLRAFDIIREGKGGAPIIDITGILVGEVPAGFALDLMRQFRMRMVDPRRSYIQKVKAFPQNIDIRFYQTWVPDPAELFKPGDDEKSDDFARLHLSHQPAPPARAADAGALLGRPRGLFQRALRRLRHRGARQGEARLHPALPPGEEGPQRRGVRAGEADRVLPEPRKCPSNGAPISSAASRTGSRSSRRPGFARPSSRATRPTPKEDPDWDPEDVRYNVIRWTPSGRAERDGPGGDRSAQRRGHLLARHLLPQRPAPGREAGISPRSVRSTRVRRSCLCPTTSWASCCATLSRTRSATRWACATISRRTRPTRSQQLRSREWTERWGTSASIMDYARMNYVAQPGDNAYLLPKFGPYDYFAIEWGYRQFTETVVKDGKKSMRVLSSDAEIAKLDELAARQVDDPMLRFGGEDESADARPEGQHQRDRRRPASRRPIWGCATSTGWCRC